MRVREYDLFVPLYSNDGTPIEAYRLQALQDRLLEEFGGLTVFPQPNEGYWRMGGVTHRDEIIILRVVAANSRAVHRFFKRLKDDLKRELKQEEILIIVRDVDTL